MNKRSVRVLILTADAGFGHRSAANAVSKALIIKYGPAVDVRVMNPLDLESAPFFLREAQTDYDRWVKQVPELYKLGYLASDATIPKILLEDSLAVLLFEAIRETFASFKPDVVLTTYPLYQSAVSLYYKFRKIHIPFFTVVTDLSTVHQLWFHKKVDGCLVPNEIVSKIAENSGIEKNNISITGIPVSPDILLETRSADSIRSDLGWQTGLITILAVGSNRTEKILDAVNVLNHYGGKMQLAVVAGKNEELYHKLYETDWHIPVHLYDFVDKMAVLMKASDLIICKAGGLIVTESLASGLPMLLTDIIPGQETGNAEYVTTAGAGLVAETPLAMLEAIHHLMKDNQIQLRRYSDQAKALGKPGAAFDVASLLWNAGKARADQQASYRLKARNHVQ